MFSLEDTKLKDTKNRMLSDFKFYFILVAYISRRQLSGLNTRRLRLQNSTFQKQMSHV